LRAGARAAAQNDAILHLPKNTRTQIGLAHVVQVNADQGRPGLRGLLARHGQAGSLRVYRKSAAALARRLADSLGQEVLAYHSGQSAAQPSRRRSPISLKSRIVLRPAASSLDGSSRCSRILYGLSSIGISLDLGAGEESAKTYRKRAYQRLRIGSERELLHWYLAQWSAWRGHLYAPVRNTIH